MVHIFSFYNYYCLINLNCQTIAGMVFAQNKHVDKLGGPKNTQHSCGK